MKKSILAISVATVFAAVDVGAAVLPAGAVLTIEAGSQFSMGGDFAANLVGEKGLYVGANFNDHSSGSRGGQPTPAIRGATVQPWAYFSNTGINFMDPDTGSGTFSGDTNPAVGVDMSGWIVTWNGISNIPMGGCQYGDPANNGGFGGCDFDHDGFDDANKNDAANLAVLTCDATCADGETYTITHSAHVPAGDPSNFGGVLYEVILTGTINVPAVANTPPVPADDYYEVATDATGVTLGTVPTGDVVLNSIARNDIDNDINDAPNIKSIDLQPGTGGIQLTVNTTLGGLATLDAATGVVTYDAPGGGITGLDTFTYAISDFRGPATATATVTVNVGNIAPVANDDLGQIDREAIPPETFVDIDVLANDTDANGNGTIDNTTIGLSVPTHGTAADQGFGVIRYTVTDLLFRGIDTFTYTVYDNAGAISNVATVSVKLIGVVGPPIAGVQEAYIVLAAGKVQDKAILPAVGDGSWFSMELQPGTYTYTPVVGLNHIQVSETITQSALSPNVPNIDNPWLFSGAYGLSQTTKPVKQLSNSAGVATLDFSGWNVTWNAIASINMGSGQDKGVATLTCYTDLVAGTPGDCSNDGEQFILTYRAIVPLGDVSGFGGVNYAIHFEGYVSATAPKVGCLVGTTPADVSDISIIDDCTSSSTLVFAPGLAAQAVGNTTGRDLTAADIGVNDPQFNPKSGEMCAGGCLDFIIDGVSTVTKHVDIVVKLAAPIPEGGVYRKLVNGRWINFNTSGDDEIGSQPLDGTTGNCQGPQGVYDIGLRPGAQCLYLKIYDGGPNDADGLVNGTIVDPSGVLLSGAPNVPPSSTDGCSISGTPVNLIERADWLLVAGFLAMLGLVRLKRTGRS